MDFNRKISNDKLGKVLIAGKGVTGLAVQSYLNNQGSRVTLVDLVEEPTLDDSKLYDLCITSPGISEFSEFYKKLKLVAEEVISEVEFAFRESEKNSRWIAITGTNGKTTTTALSKHILKAAGKSAVAVGNIGETCISQVDGTDKFYVAECSSYQLASTKLFAPDAAAILNITPDHIKWHKNLDNYAKAKFKIFKNLKDNADSLLFLENSLVEETGADSFSCKVETDVASRLRELVLSVSEDMKIKGEHNIQNAVCAATLCSHFGVTDDTIRKALLSFEPLEHRIEPCGEVDGVKFFNDSKATNIDSTIKALSAFPKGHVVLLLGGTDKMSDLEPLVLECEKKVSAEDNEVAIVKCVVCYGEAKKRFLEAFLPLKEKGVEVQSEENLKCAFDVARRVAESGDTILLSPACASFDEFSGFEERGEFFKSLINGKN